MPIAYLLFDRQYISSVFSTRSGIQILDDSKSGSNLSGTGTVLARSLFHRPIMVHENPANGP